MSQNPRQVLPASVPGSANLSWALLGLHGLSRAAVQAPARAACAGVQCPAELRAVTRRLGRGPGPEAQLRLMGQAGGWPGGCGPAVRQRLPRTRAHLGLGLQAHVVRLRRAHSAGKGLCHPGQAPLCHPSCRCRPARLRVLPPCPELAGFHSTLRPPPLHPRTRPRSWRVHSLGPQQGGRLFSLLGAGGLVSGSGWLVGCNSPQAWLVGQTQKAGGLGGG